MYSSMEAGHEQRDYFERLIETYLEHPRTESKSGQFER